jgi:hypothetical protein
MLPASLLLRHALRLVRTPRLGLILLLRTQTQYLRDSAILYMLSPVASIDKKGENLI